MFPSSRNKLKEIVKSAPTILSTWCPDLSCHVLHQITFQYKRQFTSLLHCFFLEVRMLWFNVLHGHIFAAFELNCFKRTCCRYTIRIHFCPTPWNDASGWLDVCFCSAWLQPCNIIQPDTIYAPIHTWSWYTFIAMNDGWWWAICTQEIHTWIQ